ncbi:MAG: Zn-dependent hydrolase [Paraburkholderia sp.]|uniref:Zn-dependent hydrolase n=1 Tax=Burkholderiaceae TaxID=119060 RepID=UPI0010F8E6AB|nr:Zn-dependent hydrolase [Burkholderia sp. 4M9327F10]
MITVEPDLGLAAGLFDALRESSFDGVGVTRDSYGAGEQRAHDLVACAARGLGLEVSTDAALNLYMTLKGENRAAPLRMAGSHLDSVPCGGNFDGAAGVVAGMAVLSAWVKAGYTPAADTTVVALRGEESAWFPVSYVGSKAAFGVLPADALDVVRSDSRGRLADCIAVLGGTPDAIRAGVAYLDPRRIDRFIELHIEQGPVLLEAGETIGIVTGICGSLRYRHAEAHGTYAHSGATPRDHRHDAVLATSAMAVALDEAWRDLQRDGHELTVTVGRFSTDAVRADISKVAGHVSFAIDVRSRSDATLETMDQRIREAVDAILARYGVRIETGPRTRSAPASLSEGYRRRLRTEARRLGIRAREMPSGAGHDAALFSAQGVPSAMIFVRNAHGSHNPDESMSLDDFAHGARLLSLLLQDG